MAAEDPLAVTKMAAVAAGIGVFARVMLALHGGVRHLGLLLIEAGVGATLGVVAAGAAVYWDPTLRDAGWPLLMVGGVAGFAGAIGTRLLDVVVAALQRRAAP
jgi:hypothetical protein